MRYAIVLFFALTVAALATPPDMLQPVREGQNEMIAQAAFAEGKLWLRTDDGRLSFIEENKDVRTPVSLPEPALALWLEEGKPTVLTCARKACKRWTVRRWNGKGWDDGDAIASDGDVPLAAVRQDGNLTVLTTKRLVDIIGNAQNIVRLTPPPGSAPDCPNALGDGWVAAVLPMKQRIYVGMNAGEWGGGLRSIDRKTGIITNIEDTSYGDLCGGPLNTACDPVHGISVEPWKPDCIVATIGLMHFGSKGRLIEVCGTTVHRLYFRNLQPGDPDKLRHGENPFGTEAFFGLIRTDDTLLAVGVDGLYRMTERGVDAPKPLPDFHKLGGVWVNFDIPGVVLVLTGINQRVSLSGAVPMMVPRNPE